jgi:Flp pilus assembly protein TadB
MDRHGTEHDTDWVPLVLIGLTALLSLLRNREAAFAASSDGSREDRWERRWRAKEARWQAREARWRAKEARRQARREAGESHRSGERGPEAPFKPVFTLVGLVGAFVALGVLLTVLSAVAALGGGGAFLVACGVPAAMIAFVVWMISRSRQTHIEVERDMDG